VGEQQASKMKEEGFFCDGGGLLDRVSTAGALRIGAGQRSG